MIAVHTIDLAPFGITLPHDRVGMVLAQPYLVLSPGEPFRCTAASRAGQLETIASTMRLSRQARHGAPKTHFTVFPEYCFPGLEGVAVVESELAENDWPTATLVIGGTDALSKEDFARLAGAPNTYVDAERNGPELVAADEWVNCGITWIKAADGTVKRWLQPKMSRAWPEQNVSHQRMFLGSSIYVFRGPFEDGSIYRFSTLVCFDWIASIDGRKAWRWLVEGLREQALVAGAEQISLSWLFVIQSNRKPSDNAFLGEVVDFFDQTAYPTVRRERSCIVFVNSAGKETPGRADLYGCTSLVFSGQTLFAPPTCHPTFADGSSRFRSSSLLSAHRDVLFRERGACIHSFAQINPDSLRAGAAGRTIALQNAGVFPTSSAPDPRAPSAAVPACVKWLNDELDSIQSPADLYPSAALGDATAPVHRRSTAALRAAEAQYVSHAIGLAASKSKAKHADEWDQVETEALKHLVHTLDIVSIGTAESSLGVDSAHATLLIGAERVDLLAVLGTTHEECIEHSKRSLPHPRRQTLLVSRDRDNTQWRQVFGSILEPGHPKLGEERRITDARGGVLHLGYYRLLEIFRSSQTPDDVQGALRAELAS